MSKGENERVPKVVPNSNWPFSASSQCYAQTVESLMIDVLLAKNYSVCISEVVFFTRDPLNIM